jgi:hypothetical protein
MLAISIEPGVSFMDAARMARRGLMVGASVNRKTPGCCRGHKFSCKEG